MFKVIQILCIIAATLFAVPQVRAAKEPEVIDSYNFDQALTDGSLTGDSPLTFDNKIFHDSGRSLYYRREKAVEYKLVRKSFDFKPGLAYTAVCWVKTRGITAGGGATIALESYDSKKRYISGSYINPGVTGTSGWAELRVPTYRIPANAASVYVVIYITKGHSGIAWFDDLQIMQVRSNLLRAALVSPAYRGLLWDSGSESIALRVTCNSVDYDITNLLVRCVLTDNKGNPIYSHETAELNDTVDITIPSAEIKPGQYCLNVVGIDRKTGQVEESREWTIEKLDGKDKLPASYVDQYGRFIYGGKPFFPLGFYFGDIQADELDEYADSPFNTLLPYTPPTEESLDLAHAKSLKVIYTIKDIFYNIHSAPRNIVDQEDEVIAITYTVGCFKDHPALLAWYVNDELSINDYRDQLESHYEIVRSIDYNHPAFEVDATLPTVSEHINVTDIMGTDPYPILGNNSDPIQNAGIWTRETSRSLPNRPIWMAVQAHNLANYKVPGAKRPPNYKELRAMAWQDICEGATGLIFYSWFDIRHDSSKIPFSTLWSDAKKVGMEIKELIPVIMSVEEPPEVTVNAGEWLNWTVRKYDDKVYIFAVNNSRTDREAAFETEVPKGTLREAFAPLEVKIIKMPIDGHSTIRFKSQSPVN